MSRRLFKTNARNRLVIAGSDSLALRLVEELNRLEEPVTAVVEDASNPFAVRMAARGARLVVGPARDAETLRAAGVDRATALALLDPDDVDNVHAALTAQELNPQLRLVMRVYDDKLATRINSLFDECTVLAPGAIAAPAFVDLVLGDGKGHTVWAGGRPLHAGHSGSVSEVFATLAADTSDGLELLPTPQTAAHLVLGPPLHSLESKPGDTRTPRERARGLTRLGKRFQGPRRTLATIMRSVTTRRARGTAGWFLALCTLSTVVFQLGLGGSWIDAFYRTITVITSTGYDDLLDANAPGWLKLFGSGVMLSGVLIMAIITAMVVDDLIDVRVAERTGLPVGKPAEHIVVCGLGAVGLRIAAGLVQEGQHVVGVESSGDSAMMASARRLGISVIVGDASDEDILRTAGVPTARCVVAATNDDVTNLQVGLASRELSQRAKVILRLFDSDLANRVGRRLGLTVSRSVSMLAAPVFAAAMVGREVTGVIPYQRGVLLVATVPVASGSDVAGMPLETMDADNEIRVLALRRGADTAWCPPPETVLQEEDELVVVVTRSGLTRALRITGAGGTLLGDAA